MAGIQVKQEGSKLGSLKNFPGSSWYVTDPAGEVLRSYSLTLVSVRAGPCVCLGEFGTPDF